MTPLDIRAPSRDFIIDLFEMVVCHIDHLSPSEFSEKYRYLPSAVTSTPGRMKFDLFPYWKEVVDCGDVNSPVREANVLKGVQIGATTAAESVEFYFACHVKTLPIAHFSADKELSTGRMNINFLPMLSWSGFRHMVKSGDDSDRRKTGKARNLLNFGPDCYILFEGAENARKQRQYSFCVMVKDELAGWPRTVGRDGDPDKLTDDRAKGYEDQRKIYRLSTPLLAPCRMYAQYLRGDQRKWMVCCLKCGYKQEVRWRGTNARGEEYGIFWKEEEDGTVIEDSVAYLCEDCLHPHTEHDKLKLFSPDNGAEWVPTAKPVSPWIRSYYLPGYYSPYGKGSWYSQVLLYKEGWDVKNNKLRDAGKMQVFYNNVLAKPWSPIGAKITLVQASAHRRMVYQYGQIPNDYARKHSGSRILFLTATVDVHKAFLAVAVWGWCRDGRCYVIDYWDWEDKTERGCEAIESPVWEKLSVLIEQKTYLAGEHEYSIPLTLIDSGHATGVIYNFCGQYESGVIPIKGVPNVARARDKEFWPFKAQSGLVGMNISVDYYKNRLVPVLKREWTEASGQQDRWHFNAPSNISDASLKELTVEKKVEERNDKGESKWIWHRPHGARNELWDLLVYAHASVDMLAWNFCCEQLEMESVDMNVFWDHFDA